MLLLVLLVSLGCVGIWLYGEYANSQPLRIVGALGCMLVCSVVAAELSGFYTALRIGTPVTTAVRDYLDATKTQLQEGNVDFVITELDGFDKRVPATYETGSFLDAVAKETLRMSTGPRE